MLRLDETNKRPSETDDLLEKVKVVAGPQPIAFGVLLGCGLRLSQEATLSKRAPSTTRTSRRLKSSIYGFSIEPKVICTRLCPNPVDLSTHFNHRAGKSRRTVAWSASEA
jgi:hypothetical protein